MTQAIDNRKSLRQARAAIEAGKGLDVVPLLVSLAESGDAEAQFLLGYMYFADCDYPFPVSVAREWLMKAKEQGHAGACYQLAWFPDAEGICSIDDRASAALLIEAGELGSVDAQRELGALFATGDWSEGKDEARAVEWYMKAAQQGHAEAQYDLGFMLLVGEGVAADASRGLEWLIKAAEQEDYSACRLLADIYADGLFGLERDARKALYWKERCRRQGET
ncbi:MAG TPA: tetratricopeptide repeat protein [Pyrinomonadaceae bacterium]|jgi:hypothetical protein